MFFLAWSAPTFCRTHVQRIKRFAKMTKALIKIFEALELIKFNKQNDLHRIFEYDSSTSIMSDDECHYDNVNDGIEGVQKL